MNYKLILWVCGGLIFLGVLGAAVFKIVQSTETYKAKEQTYHTNEPHFGFMSFGCASYKVEQAKTK